jgi:hypothetical protein
MRMRSNGGGGTSLAWDVAVMSLHRDILAIKLSNYGYRTGIFSAIELSEYRISYWRIQETIGLSDIGSRPQSIRLSDIGLIKNYRLPTSDNLVALIT